MKKAVFMPWLILICFSLYSFQYSSWVRISLQLAGSDDESASVLMPAQVELADSSSSGKKIIARDSTGIYCVTTWNIMTGDGLHDSHRRRMYEDAIKNLTDGTTRTLYSRAEIMIAAYQGIEFVIREEDASGQTSFMYVSCVISEHKGYLFYFTPVNKGRHKSLQGKTFFDSFSIRHK